MTNDTNLKVVLTKIKELEKEFAYLQKQFLLELQTNNVSSETVLGSLIMLPISLRAEYNRLMKKLPEIPSEESILRLFLHLEPYFTCIDYRLLEHLVDEFGSEILKVKMSKYVESMQIFFRETTVKNMIDVDYWPGKQDVPPNFSKLKEKINEDPKTYTLDSLNRHRRKYCCDVFLSEIILVLIGLEEANSFYVIWIIPTSAVNKLLRTETFYQEHNILLVAVDGHQLYPSPFQQHNRGVSQSI